jgi:thiol-disulfide isomerase/thioredoxin
LHDQESEEDDVRRLLPVLLLAASAFSADLKPVDEKSYAQLVASAKGKVLLVNFWATWCVPCRKEMPLLVAMEQRLRAKGFQVITVSADEPEQEAAAKAFLETHKVPAPAYIRRAKDDDAFIRLVDPKWSGALPALLLYGRDGKRVRSFYGEADMKALEAAIVKLL